MKSFKVLLIILGMTTLTNIAGVNAANEIIGTYTNKIVGGYNGSYNTANKNIPSEDMGQMHHVNNVDVDRELDIRVRKFNVANTSVTTNGSWKLLKDGQETVLTTSSSPYDLILVAGYFDLYVDSRWYYTSDTTITKMVWQLKF